MKRRPPRATRTDTLFPYPTLFRSKQHGLARAGGSADDDELTQLACVPELAKQGLTRDHRGGGMGRTEAMGQVDLVEHASWPWRCRNRRTHRRSEEHTSELQSLMRISYAVFCLKKKNRPTARTALQKRQPQRNIDDQNNKII